MRGRLARGASEGAAGPTKECQAEERDSLASRALPLGGARTIFSLALVAEVVHGAPSRFTDPARYSLAHGGKDGHPYPVPRKVYDRTIRVLKDAVERAKLGNDDKLSALRALDEQARRLESSARDVDFDALVDREWDRSPAYGGMTVMGPAEAVRERVRPKRPAAPKANGQLALPLAKRVSVPRQ